ncbi:MAG: phosphopyruvate hydratase [Oscillospiraceae bacterium]|nr:phosphopyruvate hydratase [Oscillospiraceae bacterium]
MEIGIKSLVGREILNGRGRPTVEAELITTNGIAVSASVPSGSSVGKYEAFELYDGGNRFSGRGTRKAAANISGEIAAALVGVDVRQQRTIDSIMCELDGTENKSRLGGNAILAVSQAVAKAGARAAGVPLYQYLGGQSATKLPDIASTVISGGAFSPSGLEFEDYLMILEGFPSFADQLEALCVMRIYMEKKLTERYGFYPEDTGAYAPNLDGGTDEAFALILESARVVGCEKLVKLGIDVASNEFYDESNSTYLLNGKRYDADTLLHYYVELCQDYPLIYIEDGFEQDSFYDFAKLKSAVRDLMVVGDDLFATNIERLKTGIATDAANTLLLKINQIGTISESFDAVTYAKAHKYEITTSLRSGETIDDFAADMAVAVGSRSMKLGSPFRAERNTKYNRLVRIEEEITSG